MYQLMLRRENS